METMKSIEAVEDLLMLFGMSLELSSNPENSARNSFLTGFKNELRKMRYRCMRTSSDYKVAVVGLGNVGKSTLLNGVFGEKIAPARNLPCTSGIIEFRYSESYSLTAESEASPIPEKLDFDNACDLNEQLTEMGSHCDGSDETAYSGIEVGIPSEVLKNGLILIDTPGFGAAGGEGVRDDETLRKFLSEDVAQIFWLVTAETGGIGADELKFYQKFLVGRCDDLVVNDTKDWSEKEKRAFKQRYCPKLNNSIKIHFVECKDGQIAREKNDEKGFKDSGIYDVCERIKKLKDADGRIESVNERLKLLGTFGVRGVQKLARQGEDTTSLFDPIWSAKIKYKYSANPEYCDWITMLETK